MQRHPEYTRDRVRQLADRMRKLIYPKKIAIEDLQVSERVDRVSYDDAQKLKKWKPAKRGMQFGPLWATYWFRAKAPVPKDWRGRRVDLLWNSFSEATLWMNGRSIQGLNHETTWDRSTRPDATLVNKAKGGETVEFQIEMACNRIFGDPGRAPGTPTVIQHFILEQCDLALFDAEAWKLFYDFWVLVELECEGAHGLDPTWAGELLFELNRFANVYDEGNRATWKAAAAILEPLYKKHNATRVHELSAIGHAHIDTAWLWPLAETWRKCIRTFSTQTRYMDEYPDFRFACSQAYQYDTIKQRNPDLYARIKAKVKAGQWIPVGGTWIEPDCNIPSGEALVRQFLYGQRFFEKEFGKRCKEFWNPDVFGYNGQLPQIMKLAGIERFLTQKLSWNRFTKPPHHTFTWEGIDGSEVLAHFPPADTYNAVATVHQLRHNVANYKDHDRSRNSLMLFGIGDGGGGPTKQMIEILRRASDLQGLPRAQMRSSEEFFDRLEKDLPEENRPKLVGELYFELHRGTYTTQAANKRDNRRCELLLHDVEFLSVVASRNPRFDYPSDEIERLWKIVLLNQFHDILPGSSIGLVYEDSKKQYAEVKQVGSALTDAALGSLCSTGVSPVPKPRAGRGRDARATGETPLNTISFQRREVATRDRKPVFVEVPSYGIGRITHCPDRVIVTQSGKRVVLENGELKATLNSAGRLLSLLHKQTNRESLASEGNRFQLYDDRPTAWDAWDVDPYHLETARDCGPSGAAKIISNDPLRAEIELSYTIGSGSTMRQIVRLDANSPRLEFLCDVDWRESNKFLKVCFPMNIRATNATYEMQFGAVERPTHFNTAADLARYEVPGHKWADLSEHGFGVALLSESKYGYSTLGNEMHISLLRSPKYPDPEADMGRHAFSYAIYPHEGDWRVGRVVAEAFRFNVPVLFAAGSAEPMSFASVDDPNLVLDTIKKAEDSDALVLRLYECHGARGRARVALGFPVKRATVCNVLEDEVRALKVRDSEFKLEYAPYQIITVMVV